MKKYFSLLLVFVLLLGVLPVGVGAAESAQPAPAPTEKPVVVSEILRDMEPAKAKAALLMDAETHEVLYELNGYEDNYPASMTKVMTALLTLEAVDRGELTLEELATASSTFGYDLEVGGSTANIKEGEQMTVLELLYCLMLPSANEAANILAERVAGDIPSFVARMNQRAAELGMEHTHYANAHGLHNAGHHTTAHDMALVAAEALNHEVFRTIVSSRTHTVPATNLSGERKLSNTNALINPLYSGKYTYPQAIGVKTGSTGEAGKCLVSAAQEKGRTLICVIMGAEDVTDANGVLDRRQFSESKRLLQWGFANFSRKTLIEAKRPVKEIAVELSADTTTVALKPETDLVVTLPNDLDPADFQQDVTVYYDTVDAPVEAGQILGELTIRNGEDVYGTVKLVAAASVERNQFLGAVKETKNFFSQTWVKAVIVVLAVLVVFLILRAMFKPRKKKGYQGRKRR